MKYQIILALVLAVGVAGCATKVERISVEKVVDLSGRWNDADARMVAQEMIKNCLGGQWLTTFMKDNGRNPTVIVGTGGVEPNGPYVALGKHNYVLQATTEAIARQLGNALVAPLIKFVPEGSIAPPTGHMQYPGTISLREETFEALLADVCSSLKQHGFTDIVLIGDHDEAQRDADLRRRQTDANLVVHRLGHVGDDLAEFRRHVADRRGALAERGISIFPDF